MTWTRAFIQLRPILAALSRHKVATALIVLQVALTLAVASNALFIVATRIVHLARATGTDEAHLFVIRNRWSIGQNANQIEANIRADLATLRHVPGVRDAFSSYGFPLGNDGDGSYLATRIKRTPEQTTRGQFAQIYAADEHAIDTLGVSLVAGRNFRPDEIVTMGPNEKISPSGIIITRSLADKLFPTDSALGKTVYLPGGPAPVIGILASLQGPISVTRASDGDCLLVPAHYVDPADAVWYLLRTDGTDMKSVIARSLSALRARGGVRILDPMEDVTTMPEARERAYATDRNLALLMSIISALLLLATAGGIVGLSSFWVSQRRRQIGVRRSLGATTGDILRYFHAENFLIVGGGVVLGLALAVLTNLGLMKVFFPLPHMPFYAPVLGALVLWLLGQLAVWGPARSAARVPPVVAIRSE